MPLTWLALVLIHDRTGWPKSGWIAYPLWLALVVLVMAFGHRLTPARLHRLAVRLFGRAPPETHGSAHFGTRSQAARHLAPAAPADAFVLGTLPGLPRRRDARFRQDGHILTCAPTGAGKGIGPPTCWIIRIPPSCST